MKPADAICRLLHCVNEFFFGCHAGAGLTERRRLRKLLLGGSMEALAM